jgi:hypothetical protein
MENPCTAADGVRFQSKFAGWPKKDFIPNGVEASLEILDMIAEPATRIGTQAAAEDSTQ